MPRRYQPPVKRRKAKKTRAPGLLETAPDDSPPEVAAYAPAVSVATAAPQRAEERHITRDYSYVVAEVRRVAIVAGFVIVSLILTALFLR